MANTTLKKIAQVLDISISTVSRALKNHPDNGERISSHIASEYNKVKKEKDPVAEIKDDNN